MSWAQADNGNPYSQYKLDGERDMSKNNDFAPMDDLLEAINEYYHNHGTYPDVCISYEFAMGNIEDIDRIPNECALHIYSEQSEHWKLS